MQLNHDEIMRLTEEYGGRWGISHTHRLLQIIRLIGEGQTYNAEAVWLAAHLHDWGAYGPWPQKDVDHAVRSVEVAESFLTERGCAQDLKALVLECIRLHHSGGASRSIESILLSDADALDFLGVVGVLRDFSKNPKDMRKAYETTRKRRAKLPGTLCLEKSRELAVERLRDMDVLLEKFEQDSWGYF